MKTKTSKKKDTAPPHPWAALSMQTSFDIAALSVLAEHHRVLRGFCVDTPRDMTSDFDSNSKLQITDSARSSSPFSLSFEQYCLSLRTLILYGTATQQFEYLFHTYAVESDRGITRAEIFQLLQDHHQTKRLEEQHVQKQPQQPFLVKANGDPTAQDAESRYFERLYTWLKKHMVLYDTARCGVLSCKVALDMLHTHPTALQQFRAQVDPLVAKMKEINVKYREKATAAQLDEQ